MKGTGIASAGIWQVPDTSRYGNDKPTMREGLNFVVKSVHLFIVIIQYMHIYIHVYIYIQSFNMYADMIIYTCVVQSDLNKMPFQKSISFRAVHFLWPVAISSVCDSSCPKAFRPLLLMIHTSLWLKHLETTG